MIELYLAADAGGPGTSSPSTITSPRPEIGYILADSEREGVRRRRALRRVACRGAAEATACRRRRCFAVGAIAGFRAYAELSAGQPTPLPADRAAGQVMNYTSGTTGRPKGVRRALTPFDPDTVFSMFAMFLGMFGITPEDDNVHLTGSPLYHTAVLVFAGCSLHYGHTRRADGQVDAGGCLEAIQRYRVTTSHMVPTQFHRLLALPGGGEGALRRLVAAPHGPRRGALPDRREAAHARSGGGR